MFFVSNSILNIAILNLWIIFSGFKFFMHSSFNEMIDNSMLCNSSCLISENEHMRDKVFLDISTGLLGSHAQCAKIRNSCDLNKFCSFSRHFVRNSHIAFSLKKIHLKKKLFPFFFQTMVHARPIQVRNFMEIFAAADFQWCNSIKKKTIN